MRKNADQNNSEYGHFLRSGSIKTKILEKNDNIITRDLLFGNIFFDVTSNSLVLDATIDYLISTKRFDGFIFAQ